MFGLSFLNAGLLIFATATVLPLIIWFIARKKPPRIIFSTLRFIRQSDKQQHKKTQLKNILLLIIRMLIILLVALAVSRPMLKSDKIKSSTKHPPTAVAIILDTSYSMDYIEGGKTVLDKAKETLRHFNGLTNQTDNLILVTADETWNQIHSQIYAGKLPESLIDNIKVCWNPLSLDKMVTFATKKLKDTMMTNREIYWLTDLQEQELPSKTEYPVTIIPLEHHDEYINISCQNAKPLPQLIERSRAQLMQFELTNYGNKQRKDVLVKVQLNNTTVAEKFVTLAPLQKLTDTIVMPIQVSGWQSGFIEVVDESLDRDNRSWFAFPYYFEPKIAVITQRSALSPVLHTILSIYATAKGTVDVLSQDRVSGQQLKSYNLIVIYDPGSLSVKLKQIITSLNQANKGILYCLNRNVSSDWKGFLSNEFKLNIGNYQESAHFIDYHSKHHFVTSIFSSPQLLKSEVRYFWQSAQQPSSEVLLSSQNIPLATANQDGLLWLFDIDNPQNKFFWDAAFPVFAYRSCHFVSTIGTQSQNLDIGKSIIADSILLPDDTRIDLNGNTYILSQPGIYQIMNRSAENYPFAVNPDYRESYYRKMDVKSNKRFILLDSNWKQHVFHTRLGHDLWKYLLLSALVLFILEVILVKSEEFRKVRETEQ